MQTFSIQTLGCKVNQYESEQLAALFRAKGLIPTEPHLADLRVVNTCSVTMTAAGKSRQAVRQSTRLPVLQPLPAAGDPNRVFTQSANPRARVLVTGCWATSDKAEAAKLPGVNAVLGHHDDISRELDRLLAEWTAEDSLLKNQAAGKTSLEAERTPKRDDKWMNETETLAGRPMAPIRPLGLPLVKQEPALSTPRSHPTGTTTLPLLNERQTGHQRAFLKIQDGCDAHCTYCIIPSLRPVLWSKPVDDAVEEAARLIAAGHLEIVLTGIFLGAYGQPTAIRRRQPHDTAKPLAELVHALCTRVPGLKRLRLSSLEPGDLTAELISVLRDQPQVAPHFHLPLQSGSNRLLHRMNRQYAREDFLEMATLVREAFDRPAMTTDILVGFPGETEVDFQQTLDVVEQAKFIHIHAFPFSPRPKTAAARWTKDFVRGPVVNDRINMLRAEAWKHSFSFRQQFVGEEVELLVEESSAVELKENSSTPLHHGRCDRYFSVIFEDRKARAGELVRARINRVTPHRTLGTKIASVTPSIA